MVATVEAGSAAEKEGAARAERDREAREAWDVWNRANAVTREAWRAMFDASGPRAAPEAWQRAERRAEAREAWQRADGGSE